MFQSTFPHGERLIDQAYQVDFIGVSIHVPARGTTEPAIPKAIICASFNPRSRTGNDWNS